MRSNNQQVIGKGSYSQDSNENAVSVKQYLYVLIGNKRHLLLRFVNNLDVNVDEVRFEVTQLDWEGNPVRRDSLVCPNLTVEPGQTFAPASPLPLDECCADFTVQVHLARAGDYCYEIRDSKTVVRFEPQEWKQLPASPDAPVLTVKSKCVSPRSWFYAAGTLATLLMLWAQISPYLPPLPSLKQIWDMLRNAG